MLIKANMNKIFSAPNAAILVACLAWLLAYYAALFALGDPKPVDPDSPADTIRFEKQIKTKNTVVITALVFSIVLSFIPFILSYRRWKNAKIRFSFSLIVSSSYLGIAAYYYLTT